MGPDFYLFVGYTGPGPVKVPGSIRAGRHAIPAAETARVDLADNAGVAVVIGGGGRTDRYAG